MNLPNLLNLALTVIPKQTVEWYAFSGNITQPNGLISTGFADPVAVVGSFQPVPKSNYQALELDFNKEYVRVFTSTAIGVLARDIPGDEFIFAGARYHVMSNTEWKNVNGWNENLAVKL